MADPLALCANTRESPRDELVSTYPVRESSGKSGTIHVCKSFRIAWVKGSQARILSSRPSFFLAIAVNVASYFVSVTVNVCLAMVKVPVRSLPVLFAPTV